MFCLDILIPQSFVLLCDHRICLHICLILSVGLLSSHLDSDMVLSLVGVLQSATLLSVHWYNSVPFAYMVWSIIPDEYQPLPPIIFHNVCLEILQMVDSIHRIHFIIKIIYQFLIWPYHGYVCRELPSTTVMFYLLLLTFKTQWLMYTRFLYYGSFIFKCYYNSLFLRADATCL